MITNTDIIKRYFAAIDALISARIVRGLKTICDRYALNRWNMVTLRNEPQAHIAMMQPAWLAWLVRDYMLNPLWLLTGEGDQFRDGWNAQRVHELHHGKPEKVQIKRKRGRPRKNNIENQTLTTEGRATGKRVTA